jgi:thiamine-phosphate pyrophosphorylase
VFEVPCVGYAASIDEVAPLVQAGADFVALGDWLWRDAKAVAATVIRAAGKLRLPEGAA